jgi:hypothetical protein
VIIVFPYGNQQSFRPRLDDLTVLGRVVVGQFPMRSATWSLNGAPPVPFYVESVPDHTLRAGRGGGWFTNPIDWRFSYKDSPAGLRLQRLGDFCVEIPVAHPALEPGANHLQLTFEDHGKNAQSEWIEITWDPSILPVDLDLTTLSAFDRIQDLGQPVNGAWILDRDRGTIRAGTPAAPDSLLVLGSPHSSQEATYRIEFTSPVESKYLGLSDWFVRNEDEAEPLGIKPGYSTAGLATLRPNGEARVWLSRGDNAHREDGWLVMTDPAVSFRAEGNVPYRVRHQVLFGEEHVARFRIWAEGEPEPDAWLCSESDRSIEPGFARFGSASFALFMHTGVGTKWSDIKVTSLGKEV